MHRSMRRTQSMGDLLLISPDIIKRGPQPDAKGPPTNDDGWLVKIRTNRYLENARNREIPSRTRSVGDLSRTPKQSFASDRILISQTLQKVTEDDYQTDHPSKGGDELSWQLKKEFHLSKYTERRRSSFVSEAQHHQQQSLSSSHHQEYESNRYHSETPLSRQKRTNSQLLYPPGSTDQIASEHTPAQRPPEKTVYENKPLPPAVVSLNITPSSSQQSRLQGRFDRSNQPPSRHPEDDYSERLMSPPPGRQTPKSILKQSYSQQQHYSDQEQSWEQSSHISRQQQTSNMSDQPSAFPNPPSNDPSNRNTNRTPAHYGSNYELDEAENIRIMQENLRKHREQRNYTPQNVPRYPTTSFNGPFFKLEEVTAPHSNGSERPRSQSVAPVMNQEASERQRYEEMHFQEQYNQYQYQQQHQHQHQQQQMSQMKNISASEMELNRHNENAPTGDDSVVIWPPPPKGMDRPRPASAMARSVLDPERIDEFRKQKQREMEAMRRRDERESLLHQRQLQAMQIQQQRLYEQRQQLINEQPQRHSYSYPPPPSQQPQSIPIQNIPQINTLSPTEEIIDKPIPQYAEDPGPPPPSQMRIFETRPISALSGEYAPDPRETMMSPNALNTWRRTYLVDKPSEVAAKNQILTSEELLEREQFEVDLLKRREAFIEKPEEEPEIFRTGKRWQPPPEKPYIWPTLRRPVTVEPGNEPTVNFAPGPPDEGEYRWQPIVYDPNYKKEKKNFTPTNSPPHSPRRGLGTGPLDDVAKRQTRYVIQPSPDGSHRPRPAFKPARQTPSGGFLPHAPNAVKIVKKRSTQIHNSLSPNYVDQEGHEVEVIHEKNFHRLDDPSFRQQTPSQNRSRSLTAPTKISLNDWEKIYDLPPHSSTITNKDPPPNIDVRRRLQLFESQAQATLQRRAYSERRNSESAAQEPKKDDKPRSIMKRSQLESREQMTYAEPERRIVREHHREIVQAKPKITETVQRVEENKRTEEVERRVIRRERRQKSSRHRYGHGHQEYVDWNGGGQWRSNSMQRGGGHNGYLPAYESYNRSTSTRRDRDRENFGDFSSNRFIDNRSGLAHARYGSLSDSLRRGELKYVPNGDVRENYNRSNRMHKSYSTRDVFHDNGRDASWRRGSAGPAPLIEFPPTLPRSARGEPPLPPPHRGYSESNSHYRPISKSRSYADWDEGRGPFGSSVKRYDDDMARLENEFRDSLLMRLPNGNMNEKDYRHEQIPGGHETYSKESKANSGRRLNREGVPSDFKEASQEYSFKREVQH